MPEHLNTRTPEHPTPASNCGPRALALVCQRLGVAASVEQLRQLAGTTEQGTTFAGLKRAAEAVGLKAEGVQVSREALPQVETPAIAWVNENHYIVVWSLRGEGEKGTAQVRDPNRWEAETMGQERLLQLCSGYLLLLRR